MDSISIIGFVAGILGTICYLPQVIKAWKTKETKDLSLLMYITISLGMVLWFIYGLALREAPIYLANGIALLLTTSILYLKIKYG